jgi:acyl phosphate:glycerol-3-phosphate acyltransferase
MLSFTLMIILSYLLGSLPTAIITGHALKGIDIRKVGSGNAGATNVFRVLGWKAGLFVLLIDMAKGLIATIFIYKIAAGDIAISPVVLQIIAGMCAVLGHIWTIFAGFKGGKGVGAGAGMIIGLVPGAVLAGLIVFVLVVATTRFVSLGSILASLTIPVFLFGKQFLFHVPVSLPLMILGVMVPLLIIFTHRSNIQRLISGNENKIKFSKN